MITQDQRNTIVKRLRDLQNFWSKDPSPLTPVPEWLNGDDYNEWSKVLEQLARDAADLLEAYEGQAILNAAVIAGYKAEVASLERMMEDAGE